MIGRGLGKGLPGPGGWEVGSNAVVTPMCGVGRGETVGEAAGGGLLPAAPQPESGYE